MTWHKRDSRCTGSATRGGGTDRTEVDGQTDRETGTGSRGDGMSTGREGCGRGGSAGVGETIRATWWKWGKTEDDSSE